MQIKVLFSIISVALGIWAFIPYLKSIFSNEAKPHAFTWLIWAVTQGTAVIGLWLGGGGLGAISLTIGTFLVIIIFLISLKRGTKNITKIDKFLLIIALSAIIVWWFLNNPILALVIVSAIDVIGFVPTFRKSYSNPRTESIPSWIYFALANVFAIAALQSYNFMTLTYIISIATVEIILIVFLALRRVVISKES